MTALSATDPVDIHAVCSDDEKAIAETVRGFVKSAVLDDVATWFEEARFPARELAKPLGDIGLLGMHLEGYGCAGTSATAYGLACLELEAGDSGLRSFVSVQGSLAMFPIRAYGSEEQRAQWLPGMASGELIGCFGLTEPDSGSDPSSMRTAAHRDGSDWILNGTKTWITNGPIADVAVVWARTDEGVRGFVVPTGTPGFEQREIHHKMSLRASATGELVFDDVRLPADAVLPGVIGMRGPLSCLDEARFGILFGALGAGRAAFEAAVGYAGDRTQFGKPIAGFQLTQAKFADMAVRLSSGLTLALHLGRLKDAGLLKPEQVSIGKLGNVRTAIEVCRTARTILGANGISLEYPVIRHMTNLESVLTYEGTEEVHALVIGKALTGLAAFS
ncbi:acyl-CoA dehydrogenase family protein [Mycolicibacterium sp.]|uniref:acyl-CoA dehydrogenase family protein n=1 Tax=Mycolicibacterium sp. TaxID=2320850 RepID=UPI003D13FE8A